MVRSQLGRTDADIICQLGVQGRGLDAAPERRPGRRRRGSLGGWGPQPSPPPRHLRGRSDPAFVPRRSPAAPRRAPRANTAERRARVPPPPPAPGRAPSSGRAAGAGRRLSGAAAAAGGLRSAAPTGAALCHADARWRRAPAPQLTRGARSPSGPGPAPDPLCPPAGTGSPWCWAARASGWASLGLSPGIPGGGPAGLPCGVRSTFGEQPPSLPHGRDPVQQDQRSRPLWPHPRPLSTPRVVGTQSLPPQASAFPSAL